MKTVGIIAEYNPFHAGHAYHIRESRRRIGEDCAVIAVMSGDYVQRGEPAIHDKFTRTRAALEGGADLVLELPLSTALSSAEAFGRGAVRLLSCLNVDRLSFGCETGNLESLAEIAELVAQRRFIRDVKEELKRHPEQSFASARQSTAERALGRPLPELRKPNSILAIEYLKALQGTGILPLAVERIGAGHDEIGENDYPSASELRRRIREEGGGPDEALQEILILDRLRRCGRERFPEGGLGDRLLREIGRQGSLRTLTAAAASKRYPLAGVRRACLRAALGLEPEDRQGETPLKYIRVLGFRNKGREVLRRGAEVPLLTRAAHVRSLSEEAYGQFACEAAAHDFYRLLNHLPAPGEDWRHGPVICI